MSLPVSETLQGEIENWRAKYERLSVRWLAGKNLHITLVPPWCERDAENVKEICRRVKEKAFDVLFEKVEFGPDPRRPRLIWAEGKVPNELIALKSGVEKALGKEPEKRPFRLHLTVARFRPETFSSFPIKKLNEEVFWRDRVDSFALMEAHLSREGADYEVLEEFPLVCHGIQAATV